MAQRTVSGKVTDESGEGLPGVNVLIKGTTTGTQTDLDGNFRLSVEDGATLVFSYVGFDTQEVEVGARTTIDVALGGATELQEVVVTAAGIQRETRTLGYAVSTIGGEELVKAPEPNVINSLSGKIAGVQVRGGNGGLGSASRIQIRGIRTLNTQASSQPLFVVDGVPIGNQNIVSGSGISGAFDPGNALGDINAADIENITVLKGANAAALYGNRARNGVIVINTKRGKKSSDNSPSISVNSTTRFDNVLVTPDYQNQFSGGTNGVYNDTFLDGWGERLEGQVRTNYQGLDESLVAQENIYDQYFQTGTMFLNSVNISNANDVSDFRLGLTSLNQTGIAPGSQLDRYTIAINAGTKFNDVWSARFGGNYVATKNIGQVGSGSNTPLAAVGNVQGLPVNTNLDDYLFGAGNQDSTELLSNGYPRLNNFNDSPWYTAEQTQAEQDVERFYGFAQIQAQATDWLNILGRVGMDSRNDNRFRAVPVGTLGAEDGSFLNDRLISRQLTTGLLATANFDLNEDLSLQAIVGHEYNSRTFERLTINGQGLNIPGLYAPGNATSIPTSDDNTQRFYGAYGDVTLTYKGWATLNVTGRNDWSSTLPAEERSFFYPSVSTSFVFTDAFNIQNNIINYGKVRASWARVGSDTQPYQLAFNYFPVTNIRGQFGQGNTAPFLGQALFRASNQIPPQALTPEFTNSLEVGFDGEFWDGRIEVDFTYYDIETTDQILAVPTAEATGFGSKLVNFGDVENKGFELALTINPLRDGPVNWSTTFNFMENRFRVTRLPEGVDEVTIANSFSGFAVEATVGEDLGLTATTWARDSLSGRPLIDPTTGLRRAGETERVGNVNPDWNLGINNTITYKGIRLGFLIDIRKGGSILAGTTRNLRNLGLAAETAAGRTGSIVDTEGVIVVSTNADGTNVVRDNDVAVTPEQFWTNYSSSTVLESSIFDASFVKLREVVLSYSLPASVIGKTPFKSITVGFEARNVALLWARTQHIDPEASLFQATSPAAGSEERFGVPSTRSVGFNIGLGF